MSITRSGKKTQKSKKPRSAVSRALRRHAFRSHLQAEYIFIVACLLAAALAMAVFAIRHARKDQQNEQLAFEHKLRLRRRTNPSGATSN